LKLIFYPDFNVKNSEWIYRAADLSEQISMAGKEASGTGNMKFAMNGALTIGTLDGANVEIREQVGKENFFLFGATVEEISSVRSKGYDPYSYYQNNVELREVIDFLGSDVLTRGNNGIFVPLVQSLLDHDPYFLLYDYQSYIDCQQEVSNAYNDPVLWTTMSVNNVAAMGKFSSDRSIRNYCSEIWNITP
jgi:starch phosphorylase